MTAIRRQEASSSTWPTTVGVRIAFDQPGDQPESWTTATEQSGWDQGAGELGTPGLIPTHLLSDQDEPDQTGIDPLIEPTTWAILKEHLTE